MATETIKIWEQALRQKLYIIDSSLVNEIILSIRTQMQLPSYS